MTDGCRHPEGEYGVLALLPGRHEKRPVCRLCYASGRVPFDSRFQTIPITEETDHGCFSLECEFCRRVVIEADYCDGACEGRCRIAFDRAVSNADRSL